MKVLATHQPNYFPWLGYFYKIHQAEIFVFLDDVSFIKKGMQNYCYLKTPEGLFRLKIPVVCAYGDLIMNAHPNRDIEWKDKHLKTLEYHYKRAAFFDEVFEDVKTILLKNYKNLAELDMETTKYIAGKLGINARFVRSSELKISTTRAERIYEICRKLEADVYYSGTGARVYQEESEFETRGIRLKYSEFKVFAYKQLWGDFNPNVSILDYLMNHGYDWQRVIDRQTEG
jgi:hypothetical protein